MEGTRKIHLLLPVSSNNINEFIIDKNYKSYKIEPLDSKAILGFISRLIPEKSNLITDFCNNNANILKLLSNPFNLTVVMSIVKSLEQKESIVDFLEN